MFQKDFVSGWNEITLLLIIDDLIEWILLAIKKTQHRDDFIIYQKRVKAGTHTHTHIYTRIHVVNMQQMCERFASDIIGTKIETYDHHRHPQFNIIFVCLHHDENTHIP